MASAVVVPASCPGQVFPTGLLRPLLRRHRGGVGADQLVKTAVPAATQLVRQLRLDGGDEAQPVEDERAVELDQAGARPDLRQRRLAGTDAANPDERERSLD